MTDSPGFMVIIVMVVVALFLLFCKSDKALNTYIENAPKNKTNTVYVVYVTNYVASTNK